MIVEHLQTEIARLEGLLESEREEQAENTRERRSLQDRLLVRHGSLPIFEEPQPAPNHGEGKRIESRATSTARAQARRMERSKAIFKDLDKQIAEHITAERLANATTGEGSNGGATE